MTSKQRSFLRKMANTLPSLFQVGKGGIGEATFLQFDEVLEARELIKGSVLNNAMLSSREAADQISEAIGADVVSVVGSKFVLYRKSKEHSTIVLPKVRQI